MHGMNCVLKECKQKRGGGGGGGGGAQTMMTNQLAHLWVQLGLWIQHVCVHALTLTKGIKNRDIKSPIFSVCSFSLRIRIFVKEH